MYRKILIIILTLSSLYFISSCVSRRAAEKEGFTPAKEQVVTSDQEAAIAFQEVKFEEKIVKTTEVDSNPQAESSQEREDDLESITQVIEEIENCYITNNFDKWVSLLTPSYRTVYNDSQFLAREGWDACDIESFFHLLVEARKRGNIVSLPVSRIEFVNPDKALVYVIFENSEFPKPQHTLIRIEGTWYKGIENEGEN